ncbi:hypothetical protein ACJX0J_010799 [Zea mays]
MSADPEVIQYYILTISVSISTIFTSTFTFEMVLLAVHTKYTDIVRHNKAVSEFVYQFHMGKIQKGGEVQKYGQYKYLTFLATSLNRINIIGVRNSMPSIGKA